MAGAVLAVAIVLALLIGLSLGLLGGGGSILTLPILRYVLGLDAHEAIAVSLFVVGTTSAAALIPHAVRGRVAWRTGVVFGLAGMVGAFASGRVAHLVPSTILLVLFGVLMMVTSIAMLRGRREARVKADPAQALPLARVVSQGLAVGGIAGLVGAGGGFLVVPALVLFGGLAMETAVGTSLVVITMQSFAGFAGHLGHTRFDWQLAAIVATSAVLGSLLGAALASSFSPDRLRRFFAWFVAFMAFLVLGQELPRAVGVEASMPWVLAGALLGMLLVMGVAQRALPRPDATDRVAHGPT